MTTATVDIWLIEDNEAFRRNVARALDGSSGLRCSGQFRTCEEALAHLAAGHGPPDIVLLDVGLPGMSGIEGLARLAEAAPNVKSVVLTVFEDHDKVFRALSAGATGYLLKTATIDEIAFGIRQVMEGGAPISPRIARRVLDFFKGAPTVDPDYGLSAREKEILEMMADGLVKKEIADRLSVSYHTVDTYVRRMYRKLHVTTRAAAVAKAVKRRP